MPSVPHIPQPQWRTSLDCAAGSVCETDSDASPKGGYAQREVPKASLGSLHSWVSFISFIGRVEYLRRFVLIDPLTTGIKCYIISPNK